MTEDEAKTKWCPKCHPNSREKEECIASECMWWVWDMTEYEAKRRSKSDDWQRDDWEPVGHCGAIKHE